MVDQYSMHDTGRSGMSTGAKVAIGCGVITLIVIALICAGGFFGIRFLQSKIEEFQNDWEAKGYTVEAVQTAVLTSEVQGPHAYFGQSISIQNGADDNLAFLCQFVDITGVVQGSIEQFMGQSLTLKTGCLIEGDVHINAAQDVIVQNGATINGQLIVDSAQSVSIEAGASVLGGLRGSWQTLNQSPDAIVGTPKIVEPDPDMDGEEEPIIEDETDPMEDGG